MTWRRRLENPSTRSSVTEKTRLQLHRERLIEDGYRGPLIQIEDLDSSEVALVNRDFFSKIHDLDEKDLPSIFTAYVSTLHQWGIMCPHPHSYRSSEASWFECLLCGAAVIGTARFA